MDGNRIEPCDIVYVVAPDSVGHPGPIVACVIAVGRAGVLLGDVRIGPKYTTVGQEAFALVMESEVYPTREAAEASICRDGQPEGAPMK